MTPTRFALLCGVSFLSFVPSAFAESLPPVVVSATRYAVPANQIASSVTVMTEEDIAKTNKQTVADVLRTVPGVTIANNGGVGQTSRVFMRGTNSNHVLVLIDGVIANDPSDPGNTFDFANLNTDNVERIEVLRGPQSTIYGSDALGGVINIISKKGKGEPRATGMAEYGRYNSSRLRLGVEGESGSTSYSFTLSGARTDGISAYDKKFRAPEKDGSENYTVSGKVEEKISDMFTAKLNARYNSVVSEFDSLGSFNRAFDDAAPENDSRQFNGRAAGEITLYDGKWVQELGLSTLRLNRQQITVFYDSLGNELFGRQQQWGWRDTADWVHHLKFVDHHVFSVGGESRGDHFKSINTDEKSVLNNAVFAGDQMTYGDAFANVSARTDFNSQYGRQFTWKVAPGYFFDSTGTTLKASYGTGFKAPSLSQVYEPSYGNRQLRPERSKGWELGFEQALPGGDITFGSTAFRNQITQLISNANTAPFAGINIGKARTQGLENVFSWQAMPALALNASYTYTISQDRSGDRDLLRRPRHMAGFGSTWQYSEEGDVTLSGRYSSSRRDINVASPFNRLYVKSFTVIDLSTNYRITPSLTLYGRVENLLDKRYEEVYGYGQPGMGLYIGAKSEF
jgi:vitamin B12 transporter